VIPRSAETDVCYCNAAVESRLISQPVLAASRAFIIIGATLANSTPLIGQIERLLGSAHAGTYAKIGQHAPVEILNEVADSSSATQVINTPAGPCTPLLERLMAGANPASLANLFGTDRPCYRAG
jgi:hypothetical protein